MPLNLQAVEQDFSAVSYAYGWQEAVLYALSVGATELKYLYEKNLTVLPGFLTTLAFRTSPPLLEAIAGDPHRAVFGEQTLERFAPLPPSAHLRIERRITGIYDLGSMSIATLSHRFYAPHLLAQTSFSLYYPGITTPEAPRPPRSPRSLLPTTPPQARLCLPTHPQQAALFRLNGDPNPLHIDPEAAALLPEITQGRPILHGLCLYGMVARAIETHYQQPLTSMKCRFSRPLWPGDSLDLALWHGGAIKVSCGERPEEEILTHVRATTGE